MTKSYRAVAAALALACFAPAAWAQTQTPQPSPTAVLQDRVEELEQLLREETDRADRAEHRARQAEREVERLQGIVSDLAAVRDARDEIGAAREAEEAPPPPERQSNAAPPPRASGTLGEIPASDIASLPRGRGADAAELYNEAHEFLSDGEYGAAQRAFTQFIRDFGDDPNAAEARYWRAFALLAVRANNEAALGFSDYLQRYPRGPKAPDSYVRLGMALKAQDMSAQACAAFAEFRRRYPRAHPALRELAARESRGLECGG